MPEIKETTYLKDLWNEQHARTLGENRGAALLTMERIAYDDTGRPVEFGQHLYRASRYAFTTSFPRPDSAPPHGPPAGGW